MKRFDIKEWQDSQSLTERTVLPPKIRKEINKEISVINQRIEKIMMLTKDNIDDGRVTSSNIGLLGEEFFSGIEKILGRL